MLILFYSIISVYFFLFLADRSKFREYYSSLLCISYLRFLEQYLLVYVLKVWEYHHLPLPLAKVSGVPILLDVTFYPMVGYLMIHYSNRLLNKRMIHYLIWGAILTFVEFTMVWTGMLEHQKYWNFAASFLLAIATVVIIHGQYRLFLKNKS
ncbi:CBO0543 family protein [Ammoniphilus resinae]|uniref:Uncharacterized protein n=1 Tax=Ammoniphilus resinae TaxID=861532 RepID=A0ABS4GXS5_9BACL|nr:CBO0543 family protein [Ammoniphilus resinae]MBP1935074.1 hypothetical protein [Ammoniphilus resinae]